MTQSLANATFSSIKFYTWWLYIICILAILTHIYLSNLYTSHFTSVTLDGLQSMQPYKRDTDKNKVKKRSKNGSQSYKSSITLKGGMSTVDPSASWESEVSTFQKAPIGISNGRRRWPNTKLYSLPPVPRKPLFDAIKGSQEVKNSQDGWLCASPIRGHPNAWPMLFRSYIWAWKPTVRDSDNATHFIYYIQKHLSI